MKDTNLSIPSIHEELVSGCLDLAASDAVICHFVEMPSAVGSSSPT